MINTIVAAAMTVSTIVVPSADSPPPDAVTIGVVAVNGSGCRAGTGSVSVSVSPDNTSFHVYYSDYVAAVGVGTRPTDFRKYCQLTLQVNVPTGYTFAVPQVDFLGFLHLESGATSTKRSSYHFQGMPEQGYWTHPWRGPWNDEWWASDTYDLGIPPWRPCGEPRNLTINTELRVSAGTSDPKTTTSYMAMDSTDFYAGTHHHFAWKRCP